MATNAISDMLRQKESLTEVEGGAKGSVAILKESFQSGCVSQDSYPRKSILREHGKMGPKHTVKILQGYLAPNQNAGKKGSIVRYSAKVCAS